MIEQDIKTIISLLEAIAGKSAPMEQGYMNPVPDGPVPPVVQQVAEAFQAELPPATTDFDTLKKHLAGMPKHMADTWYNQCIAKASSEKQQFAITKIFKSFLT